MINRIPGIIWRKYNQLMWRKNNKHNRTIIIKPIEKGRCSIGKSSYGDIRILSDGDKGKLRIGNYCSISTEVAFILTDEHPTNFVSTFPWKVKLLRCEKQEAITKGDIVIGDDVWIGFRATILSGVKIGQGAVIAAGSIVTKDIPPYAIVGGVPAKVIKYRFKKEIIDYMLTLDYSALSDREVEENIDKFYTDVSNLTLEEIEKLFMWFPKKK